MNKMRFNDGWEFVELPLDAKSYAIPRAADWKSVDIPHDWMIYDTRNLYRDSIGWYHKTFSMRKGTDRVSVRFDGVYMDSAVFVNGREAGQWKYGYSTFEFDITDLLKDGENEIWVRVVYQHCNSRWYSGAGIYRNVWMNTYPEDHILPDGVYISTQASENGDFTVDVETEVHFAQVRDQLILRQSILDADGLPVATGEIYCDSEHILREQQSTEDTVHAYVFGQKFTVKQPKLWGIGQGNFYTLKTELIRDHTVIDTVQERFGFKTMVFDPNEGFILNGEHCKLNGVCEHHDFGGLGAAFYKDAMRRKFRMLRSMGVNAIRTSHNMPAPELMDLADEMGFLVLSESFDMWEMGKTPYDYGRFFKQWCERDVRSWVRRDRNRASLLMWSIGNEIYDTQASAYGQEITKRLVRAVRQHDPKNHAPITIGSNFMKWDNGQACAALVDIAGYNYGETLYEEHHKQYPHWIIYGSETASMLASRGIYHFPLEKKILTDEDEHCSALGNSVTGWGAMSYEDTIFDDRDAKFSLGQFIWTGFDYFGESTPYQTKSSYFGQIDTAGFPKDSYYIFQAEWTDYRVAPMIHIFPYWDFNPGQVIDVQVCTNAPECELFLNGKSLGRRQIDHAQSRKTVQHWKIPYEPGKLEARAYDEHGNPIAVDVKQSFGDTDRLIAKADREEICANGTDLIFLEIQAVDQQGIAVDNARDRVNVTVTGAGRLICLDNGDSTDFDQHKGRSRRLFGGKLLAVIAAKTEPGDICVTLESASAGRQELRYRAVLCEIPAGVSARMENEDRVLVGGGSAAPNLPQGPDEIPIRKLELSVSGNDAITKDAMSIDLRVQIYPKNATYRDLQWSVLNESGIAIDYVTVTPTTDGARVTATGDGEFRVRCTAKNGGGTASVISERILTASGLGKAYLNPYQDTLAGLWDDCRGSAMDGIEHGIGFQGGTMGVVGYTHMDFGEFGTETVTVSIFANTNDPVFFRLYDGDPEDGGELLLDAKYHLKPEWMVFKPMTYTLAKRLTGKRAIYFASDYGFNFKSFAFVPDKAYSLLRAGDCTLLYGDAFTRNGSRIEHIGNNVLLEFSDMDFAEGTDSITICGRSPLEKSAIQIRFADENGTEIRLVEFKGCDEYTGQKLQLEKVTGKKTVSFVFLPGSDFDFDSFCFHRA